MGIAALPASAQIVTKGATTQSVAVVPFQNRTRLHVGALGDEAADAVAVELRDRLLLDVLPKADVALQMRDLGMTPPLTDSEMVRLATELDVPLVIAGEMRGARIIQARDGRYAEIVMAVRLFDRIARADVNGAMVSAISPTSDVSDDALIQKALQQAAFNAVQQMKARPTVTAMVLWTRDDTIYLNVGTRGGIRPGMKLVAVRSGERVALAKVTESDAIGSYATLVEGPPLRTGDSLRAVYELPAGTKPERVGVALEKRHRFETLFMTAAVLFGFGQYANRARRLDEGDTAAPNFTAAQVSNGADLGFSGWFSSFNPLHDIQGRPSALLTWGGYKGVEKHRLLGYDIRRNGEIVDVIFGQFSVATQDIDTGTHQPGFQLLDLAIGTDGGVALATGEFTPWEPKDFDPVTATFSNPTWGEFMASFAADNVFEYTNLTIHVGWFPSLPPGDDIGGMLPGSVYQYSIRPLITRQNVNGIWSIDAGTEPSRVPNLIVAVAPAGLFSQVFPFVAMNGPYEERGTLDNPDIVSNRATFYFYYPIGANDITLQIARSPNSSFTPPNVLDITVPPVGPNAPAALRLFNQSAVPQVDLSQVPGSGSLFFWRIRARNTADTHPPRAYPVDDPSLRGFVYSHTLAFVPPTGASRASMMHEQRQALDAIRAARARLPRTATTDRLHRAE
jgi:hypothetical protein